MRPTTHGSPERGPFRNPLPVVPLFLAACLASPFEPAGARFVAAPPPAYAIWWRQMEACARVVVPLDRIEWYQVPGDEFATPEGLRWGWWEPPHRIYIAATHWSEEWLVEHEMLHDLLQTGAHPVVFQACGVQRTGPVPGPLVLPRADGMSPIGRLFVLWSVIQGRRG
jgi:hypothetical protein